MCVCVCVCKEVRSVVAISLSRSCCLGVRVHISTYVHFKLQNVGVCVCKFAYLHASAHPSFCPRAFFCNTDECTSVCLSKSIPL